MKGNDQSVPNQNSVGVAEGMSARDFFMLLHEIKMKNADEEVLSKAEVNAVLALLKVFERKTDTVEMKEQPAIGGSQAANEAGNEKGCSWSGTPTNEALKTMDAITENQLETCDTNHPQKEQTDQRFKCRIKRKQYPSSPINVPSGLTLGEFAKINLTKMSIVKQLKENSDGMRADNNWQKGRWLVNAHSGYEERSVLNGTNCVVHKRRLDKNDPMPAKKKLIEGQRTKNDIMIQSQTTPPWMPSKDWMEQLISASEKKTVKEFMAESSFEYCPTNEYNDGCFDMNVEDVCKGSMVQNGLMRERKTFELGTS